MDKVSDLIRQGFGRKEDLNCSEKILYGANKAYNLNLDKESLKLAAGFGGGMGIEGTCGALSGCVMVLSKLFVIDRAHESDRIKELSQELFDRYNKEMGSIICKNLKDDYRTEELGCYKVYLKAAEILDDIVERELLNITKK